MFHDKDTDMIKRMTWDSLPGCCSPVSERTKDQIPNVRATTVSTHLHFEVLSCVQGLHAGEQPAHQALLTAALLAGLVLTPCIIFASQIMLFSDT